MGSHQNARSPTMSNGGNEFDNCKAYLRKNQHLAPMLRDEDTFEDCDKPLLCKCYTELMSVIFCLLALNKANTLAGVWPGHNKDDYVTYREFIKLKSHGQCANVWPNDTNFTVVSYEDLQDDCTTLLLVSNILYKQNQDCHGTVAITSQLRLPFAFTRTRDCIWSALRYEYLLPGTTLTDYNHNMDIESTIQLFVVRFALNLVVHFVITAFVRTTQGRESTWLQSIDWIPVLQPDSVQFWFLGLLGVQSGLLWAFLDCFPGLCRVNCFVMRLAALFCTKSMKRRAFRGCNFFFTTVYVSVTYHRTYEAHAFQPINIAVFLLNVLLSWSTTVGTITITEKVEGWFDDDSCFWNTWVSFVKSMYSDNTCSLVKLGKTCICMTLLWIFCSWTTMMMACFVAIPMQFLAWDLWIQLQYCFCVVFKTMLKFWSDTILVAQNDSATAADPSECVQLGEYLERLAAVENGLWSCSVHYSTAIKQQLGTCNAVVARRPKKVDCPGLWFSSSSTVDVDYGDEHTNYTTVVPERDCTDAVQGYKQLEQHPLHQAVVNKTLTCKELANATKTLTIVDFLHGQLTE